MPITFHSLPFARHVFFFLLLFKLVFSEPAILYFLLPVTSGRGSRISSLTFKERKAKQFKLGSKSLPGQREILEKLPNHVSRLIQPSEMHTLTVK